MKKTAQPHAKTENLSYEAAFAELQAITDALQQGQVGIDDLAEKIERANDLVRFCREKLRHTEAALLRIQEES